MDTGAQVSVIPPTWFDRRHGQGGPPLQAANGTSIPTYGVRNVSLRFNETTYDARLIIADVNRPLLGADFFRRLNLLVDLNGQRLIEADTYLSSPCFVSRVTKTKLTPIEQDSNKFRKILQEFPDYFNRRFPQTLSSMVYSITFVPQVFKSYLTKSTTPRCCATYPQASLAH